MEFFNEAPRCAAVRVHLDVKLKKDLGSEHAFKLHARRSANPFQHLPLLADQYAFLALAFAIDCRGDAAQPGPFFEAINNYRGCVGNLLLAFLQHSLATNLLFHKTWRPTCHVSPWC